jgi:hypothetical protein
VRDRKRTRDHWGAEARRPDRGEDGLVPPDDYRLAGLELGAGGLIAAARDSNGDQRDCDASNITCFHNQLFI